MKESVWLFSEKVIFRTVQGDTAIIRPNQSIMSLLVIVQHAKNNATARQ